MKRSIGFSVCVLAAVGCQEAAVFQLTSREPDARWLLGQQVLHRQTEATFLEVSFHRSLENYLVFDVSIANNSDSTLLIAPEDFSYVLAPAHGELPAGPSYAAIDPDAQIASLDRRAATEKAEHDTRVALGAAVDLTDMVAGLITSGSRTDDERSLDAQRDLEREAQRRVEDDDYESTVADLERLRDHWASGTLRRTHLSPRQSVGGRLALPAGPVRAFLGPPRRDRNSIQYDKREAVEKYCRLILRSRVGDGTHEMIFEVREH